MLELNIRKIYTRVRFELDVIARYIAFFAIKFSFIPVLIFFHAEHLDAPIDQRNKKSKIYFAGRTAGAYFRYSNSQQVVLYTKILM